MSSFLKSWMNCHQKREKRGWIHLDYNS
jgi:hypothetical protein